MRGGKKDICGRYFLRSIAMNFSGIEVEEIL